MHFCTRKPEVLSYIVWVYQTYLYIVFIVGPMLHFLYSSYLKNIFWMHAFYIFCSLIFILQIIILLHSD